MTTKPLAKADLLQFTGTEHWHRHGLARNVVRLTIKRPPAADGLPGRVTSYGYHGHDAVLHVQPDRAPDDRTLVVRIIGGPHLPVGSPVTLRARGPVFAWPRD